MGLSHALQLFVTRYGLAALFVLLVIEEAGVWLPLPGDLFVMYFGYRVSQSPTPVLAAIPVLLTVTAAVLCGTLLLYGLTRRFRYSVRRLGRVVHLNEQRLLWMERRVQRRGAWILIPGRLIPGLRVPSTVVAGLFDLPLRAFMPAIGVAALLWAALYLVLGGTGQLFLMIGRRARPAEPLPDAPGEWLLLLLTLMTATALCVLIVRLYRDRGHRGAGPA